jgi:hypothetical protein
MKRTLFAGVAILTLFDAVDMLNIGAYCASLNK